MFNILNNKKSLCKKNNCLGKDLFSSIKYLSFAVWMNCWKVVYILGNCMSYVDCHLLERLNYA